MAISVVQTKIVLQGTSSASISATPTSPLTVGSRLYVACWGSATMATATISDGSNTYTPLGSDGYDIAWLRHWHAPITTGGSLTITVTPATNRSMSILVVELSGVDGTTPVDQSGTVWQLYSSADFPKQKPDIGDATITDGLAIGVVGTAPGGGNTRDLNANTGWTQETEDTTGPSVCMIKKTVTATGVYDPDWTMASGGSAEMVFAGVIFKAAAGGSGFFGRPYYEMIGSRNV